MMLVVEQVQAAQEAVRQVRQQGCSVGFVPTMGALHAGHLSLVEASRNDCDFTAVSIFVNPTQFGPHEDYQRYPRPREADLALCESAGVDLVFYPEAAEMYPPDSKTFIEVAGLSEIWEGAIRPGHFRGVTTIVAKLFHCVPCNRAYFGQKDYQQQLILRRMTQDLKMPVEIVTCPILRDADGLALSSRNAYLTADERRAGLALSQSLKDIEAKFQAGEHCPQSLQRMLQERLSATAGLTTDYAVIVNPETLTELAEPQSTMVALLAARVGTTRLIDNAILNSSHVEPLTKSALTNF